MAFRPPQCSSFVDTSVTSAATFYNLPRYFLYSLIQRESSFQLLALNSDDPPGYGLTQLTGVWYSGTPYPMNLSAPDNSNLEWTYDMGFGSFGVWLQMSEVSTITSIYSADQNLARFATDFGVRWYQRLKNTYSTEGTTNLLKRLAQNWKRGLFATYDPNHFYMTQFNQYMADWQGPCEADDGTWSGTPTMSGGGTGTVVPPPPPPGGQPPSTTWTAPRTWADGEVVTSSLFNVHIRGNLEHLYHTSGMRFEGGVFTGLSTTSTAGVDVQTISGLTIPDERPIMMLVQFRKTTAGGSLLTAGAGLKVNGTIVSEAPNNTTSSLGLGAMTDTSTSESCLSQIWVGPRLTNHQRNAYGEMVITDPSGTGKIRQRLRPTESANWPTGTTTSIAIRGKTQSLSATLFVSYVYIYSIGFI